MSVIANSFVEITRSHPQFLSGVSLIQASSNHMVLMPSSQSKGKTLKCKSSLVVKASGDNGRGGNANIFVSGFVLGGLVVGALGCIYAPQISKALAGADRKEMMRKLPKFIYDEEKALERTRKILTEKIDQLNSAIDDVSAQLRAEDEPEGSEGSIDGLEGSM